MINFSRLETFKFLILSPVNVLLHQDYCTAHGVDDKYWTMVERWFVVGETAGTQERTLCQPWISLQSNGSESKAPQNKSEKLYTKYSILIHELLQIC
jgi:hypothetical protein